jgi:hypothetical protein
LHGKGFLPEQLVDLWRKEWRPQFDAFNACVAYFEGLPTRGAPQKKYDDRSYSKVALQEHVNTLVWIPPPKCN